MVFVYHYKIHFSFVTPLDLYCYKLIFIATSAIAVATLRSRFFWVNDCQTAFIFCELVMRSFDITNDPAFSLETFHDLLWILLYKSYSINLP